MMLDNHLYLVFSCLINTQFLNLFGSTMIGSSVSFPMSPHPFCVSYSLLLHFLCFALKVFSWQCQFECLLLRVLRDYQYWVKILTSSNLASVIGNFKVDIWLLLFVHSSFFYQISTDQDGLKKSRILKEHPAEDEIPISNQDMLFRLKRKREVRGGQWGVDAAIGPPRRRTTCRKV